MSLETTENLTALYNITYIIINKDIDAPILYCLPVIVIVFILCT